MVIVTPIIPKISEDPKKYFYVLFQCNAFLGRINYHFDGAADGGIPNAYFPMGSILVKLGCTLYMFAGNDFKADG